MLEFENVSKSFWTGTQHKVILDRVSFRVDLGHSLGVLAPNGTGKTTLINMMAGLDKPEEGEIRRACNISFPLGFMGGVIPKISAHENCRYIARLYGLDSDTYLIDEGMPASTDVEFNRKAGEVLQERLRTTTIIIVSHQAQTLEKFARSAAVLLDGKLHMFDTLEEAKRLYDYETQS